jgi:Leucine-rich repeat (LRR) protein
MDLSNIGVTEIMPGSFSRNGKISHLKLRENDIELLDETIFSELLNLSWIDLGRNKLKNLPSGIFAKNTKLRIIDLDRNGLQKICKDVFKNQDTVVNYLNLFRLATKKS